MKSVVGFLVVSAGIAVVAVGAGCAQRDCYSQNDCPSGQGCTADGACVASGVDVAKVGGGGQIVSRAGAGTAPADDGGAGADASGFALGTVSGAVGSLALQAAPATVTRSPGLLTVTAPGEGADAALYVWDDCVTSFDWETPGETHASSDDISATIWGQVCTANESGDTPHYDTAADLEIVVSAGTDASDGRPTVAITWTSTDGKQVTADVIVPPADD